MPSSRLASAITSRIRGGFVVGQVQHADPGRDRLQDGGQHGAGDVVAVDAAEQHGRACRPGGRGRRGGRRRPSGRGRRCRRGGIGRRRDPGRRGTRPARRRGGGGCARNWARAGSIRRPSRRRGCRRCRWWRGSPASAAAPRRPPRPSGAGRGRPGDPGRRWRPDGSRRRAPGRRRRRWRGWCRGGGGISGRRVTMVTFRPAWLASAASAPPL